MFFNNNYKNIHKILYFRKRLIIDEQSGIKKTILEICIDILLFGKHYDVVGQIIKSDLKYVEHFDYANSFIFSKKMNSKQGMNFSNNSDLQIFKDLQDEERLMSILILKKLFPIYSNEKNKANNIIIKANKLNKIVDFLYIL